MRRLGRVLFAAVMSLVVRRRRGAVALLVRGVGVQPRVQRRHARERTGNVPAGDEPRAIDAREVDELGRVLRLRDVDLIRRRATR